jgi:hypothetical protein
MHNTPSIQVLLIYSIISLIKQLCLWEPRGKLVWTKCVILLKWTQDIFAKNKQNIFGQIVIPFSQNLKGGHHVPLVFGLFQWTTDPCCVTMGSFILEYCSSGNLNMRPRTIHIDLLTDAQMKFCRFHLGQCWWRKIQSLDDKIWAINIKEIHMLLESGWPGYLVYLSLNRKRWRTVL